MNKSIVVKIPRSEKQKHVLHLNLKRKWFEMILFGDKTEEYRAMSKYFCRLFKCPICVHCTACGAGCFGIKVPGKSLYVDPKHWVIQFSNGYKKDREWFRIEVKHLAIGEGFQPWGAERGTKYFILKLGSIIEQNITLKTFSDKYTHHMNFHYKKLVHQRLTGEIYPEGWINE